MTKTDLQIENKHPESESNNNNTHHTVDSKELAFIIANAGDDRKADNIVILKVESVSYVAEYFVIMTGYSAPQLKAISTSVEDKVEEKIAREPLRIEGKSDPNWILHDYGDVIVHIFTPEAREYYNLQAFWGGAEEVPFTPE